MTQVATSILSADFLILGQEIDAICSARTDFVHIDVMDGSFVPNITMGPLVVSAVKKITQKTLDVHLMIDNPQYHIDAFADAGADYITVHQENCTHLERTIKHIKSKNIKVGVALNPSTHESTLEYVIDQLDLVLIMSVNPGFAAQSFLPTVVPKITRVKKMLTQHNNDSCIISVDGGINEKTAPLCTKAGASLLVAGSYIFNSSDYAMAIDSLKQS
ncbi:MAG: ribulose-phosphate 3-epimerase [Myxococcales bacterium]|nr:ribulose-phosphate 3-epimerase [Myxococcales bacterium]USN51713.1 MAG: ribulose-phosphate 3-epimerase [Myxococcales bacterium]